MMLMSEYQLAFLGAETKSKASRFFWIFKPREIVHWEPFDLHMIFKNVSDQKFDGGSGRLMIRAQQTHDELTFEIPSIEPNEVKTIEISDIVIREAGFNYISQISIQDRNKRKISCKDLDGRNASRTIGCYPLYLATREEIYQKYAVVVALLSSILATILTIVNVLVAIFD